VSSEKIKPSKTERVSHPPSRRDLTSHQAAFPFGYLKEKHHGTSFTRSDDRIVAVQQIFFENPEARYVINTLVKCSQRATSSGYKC
jgi:hypothetical protein